MKNLIEIEAAAAEGVTRGYSENVTNPDALAHYIIGALIDAGFTFARKRGTEATFREWLALGFGIANARNAGLTKPHDVALSALVALEGCGRTVRKARRAS